MNIQDKIDSLSNSLNSVNLAIQQTVEDLEIRERQIEKDKESIKREREELIKKQNIIIGQLDGMREDRERAEKMIREGSALKKESLEKQEDLDVKKKELDNREIEIEIKERKVYQLEKDKEELEERERILSTSEVTLKEKEMKLEKEQELLQEKKLALDLREQRIQKEEARVSRILK